MLRCKQVIYTFEQPSHLCSIPLFLPFFIEIGFELIIDGIELMLGDAEPTWMLVVQGVAGSVVILIEIPEGDSVCLPARAFEAAVNEVDIGPPVVPSDVTEEPWAVNDCGDGEEEERERAASDRVDGWDLLNASQL